MFFIAFFALLFIIRLRRIPTHLSNMLESCMRIRNLANLVDFFPLLFECKLFDTCG